MKWNKYRMKTTTEAVDLISYTLGEMGIEGIEIEDKIPLSDEDKKKMFIDILPELGEDDGVAYVSFYIEPEKDHAETLQEVTEAVKELADFVDIGDATIEKSATIRMQQSYNPELLRYALTVQDILNKDRIQCRMEDICLY